MLRRNVLDYLCAVTLSVGLVAPPTDAQVTEGSNWTAMAGGALGAYSGALLGTIGSVTPCTETYIGPTCVRWSAIAAGAIGLGSGTIIGANDKYALEDAAVGAGIGFLIGAGAGAVLKPIVQRFSWQDVAAMGLVGGAIGAAPVGSAIGFAAGGITGFVLWKAVDGIEMPNAVAMALGGLALGGLTEWVVGAADSWSTGQPNLQLVVPFSVSF
jgi:hypothetical protein